MSLIIFFSSRFLSDDVLLCCEMRVSIFLNFNSKLILISEFEIGNLSCLKDSWSIFATRRRRKFRNLPALVLIVVTDANSVTLFYYLYTLSCYRSLVIFSVSNFTHYVSNSIKDTNRQTNRQRDKRTDTRNRVWCILALKCDIWGQYYSYFLDSQLTNFVYLFVDRGFLPS